MKVNADELLKSLRISRERSSKLEDSILKLVAKNPKPAFVAEATNTRQLIFYRSSSNKVYE